MEIDLLKKKAQSQADYIRILEQRYDAALTRNEKECGPSLLHDLSCGMVGAAAGVVMLRGLGR